MQTIQQLIKEYGNDKSANTYKKIVKMLKDHTMLWFACSTYTDNYFLAFENDKPSAYIFSKKVFYNNFQDYLLQQFIQIKAKESTQADRMTMFGDIYRSGFEQIVIDNGQNYLKLNLFDIIDKPDFSSVSEINTPIMNPSLMKAANNFFQHYGIKKATREMEYQLFTEIYHAKYLIPIDASQLHTESKVRDANECIINESSAMSFPLIKNVSNQQFYPFFTDWIELRKFDKEHKYNGMIASFDDMKYFISQADGITINPFGVNIIITAQMYKSIELVGKDIGVDIKGQIMENGTKKILGEQKNYLQ